MSVTVSDSGFIAGKMLAEWHHNGKPFIRIFHFDSKGGLETIRRTMVWASANNVGVNLRPIRFADYESIRAQVSTHADAAA